MLIVFVYLNIEISVFQFFSLWGTKVGFKFLKNEKE